MFPSKKENRQINVNNSILSGSQINNSASQNYTFSYSLDSNSSGSNNTNKSDIENINNNAPSNSRFNDNKRNNFENPIIGPDKFIPVLHRIDYRLFPYCNDEDMKPE